MKYYMKKMKKVICKRL